MKLLNTVLSLASSGISSLIGGWQVAVAAFALGALISGFGVLKVEGWYHGAQQTAQARGTIQLVVDAGSITQHVELTLHEVQFKHQSETHERLDAIPTHVTAQDDARCVVNLGAVRMLDDAAHGPVPGPASGPDSAPSDASLGDVVRNGVENDGVADQLADEVKAWRDWYAQQSATWNKANGFKQ